MQFIIKYYKNILFILIMTTVQIYNSHSSDKTPTTQNEESVVQEETFITDNEESIIREETPIIQAKISRLPTQYLISTDINNTKQKFVMTSNNETIAIEKKNLNLLSKTLDSNHDIPHDDKPKSLLAQNSSNKNLSSNTGGGGIVTQTQDITNKKTLEKTQESDQEKTQDGDQEKKQINTQNGYLIDSAVGGVKYTTDSISGFTDSKGTFRYGEDDETITFTVGSLTIARDFNIQKLSNDSTIFPADFVGIDRNNITDERLVKYLRVLQSLDNDDNPNNGIFIDDNTKDNITSEVSIIDADISTLKTMVEDAGKIFISKNKSIEHYKQTMIDYKIAPTSRPFITVWETDSPNKNITIPVSSSYIYNYTVNWGDGTIEKNIDGSAKHVYKSKGEHIIKIYGKFPTFIGLPIHAKNVIRVNRRETKNLMQLKKITQWGDISWKSFKFSFAWSPNLDIDATDTPNLKNVLSMNSMFYKARALKGNKSFNDWDISNVTDISDLFCNAVSFNAPVNNWNVSNVTNMEGTFFNAKLFNQPLNNWNTSNVTNMEEMFSGALIFNQDISAWNTSNVTNMRYMFKLTPSFNNHDLSVWKVYKTRYYRHFMDDSGTGNTEPGWFVY